MLEGSHISNIFVKECKMYYVFIDQVCVLFCLFRKPRLHHVLAPQPHHDFLHLVLKHLAAFILDIMANGMLMLV